MGEKNQHVKAVQGPQAEIVGDDDSDTESDASGADSGTNQVMGFALPFAKAKKTVPRKTLKDKTVGTPALKNVFDLLSTSDDENGDEDDEAKMVQSLQQFAHRVTFKPASSKRKTRSNPLHVKATKILEEIKRENKGKDDEEDVEYALVDSGSSVHCMNKKKHFLHINAKRGGKKLSCATASGDPISGDGMAKDVEFDTDEGHVCSITFDDSPVSMPIIAVKLLSRRGHRTIFDDEDGGGYILHKATGQRTQMIERDGVYFLRMTKPRVKTTAGFSRPGHHN